MRDIYKKRIIIIYISITLFGLFYYLIFTLIGKFPSCFFHATTGYYCAGCGITRMFLALLNGDFSEAFLFNAAFMILIPLWLLYSFCYFINKPKFIHSERLFYIFLYSTTIIMVLFWIFRNFHAFAFLRPI